MHVTREEAITIAKHWGLEQEVEEFMNSGYEPWEALWEWDLPTSIEDYMIESNKEGASNIFTQPCFIRKNTPELRNKLKELEHSLCICTEFEGACWLVVTPGVHGTVHGVGYTSEEEFPGKTTEEFLEEFLQEVEESGYIDRGTNEKLFLALAALRDNYDMDQWFVYREEGKEDIWFICDWAHIEEWRNDASTRMSYQGASLYQSHKATPKELIEHFKE